MELIPPESADLPPTPVAPPRTSKRRVSRKRKVITYCAWGVGLVAVGTLGYTGYQGYQLATNLLAVQDQVAQIQADVSAKNLDSLSGSFDVLTEHAQRASKAANDPVLGLARFAPKYGDDFTAVKIVSNIATDLLVPAHDVATILPRLTGNNLASQTSGFDVSLLNTVATSVTKLSQAASASDLEIQTIDISALDSRIASPVTTVRDLLAENAPTLENLVPYAEALPVLLAQDSKTTWFVTMQNLGEARASGGLPGAWLVVSAENGKVEVVRQGANDELIENEPVAYEHIMPEGYQELWGDYLGSWLSMNLSANFPDNAALMLENWNSRGEEHVDGVIALGQGMLPYIAAAVGDVAIGDKTIPPAQLDDYLTVGVYEDYSDPAEKDKAVDEIIAQVFGKITSGAFDVRALFNTISEQETGDYLQLWSTDPVIQTAIIKADMGGILSSDLGPTASVRVINGGENKLDVFLEMEASYNLGQCIIDEDANYSYRMGEVNVTITNTAPTTGLPTYINRRGDALAEGEEAPAGSNHDIIAVYTPVDATGVKWLLDGEDAFTTEAFIEGRTVYLFDLELLSNESKKITVQWEEPAFDDDDNALPTEPDLILQPMYRVPQVTTASAGSCS